MNKNRLLKYLIKIHTHTYSPTHPHTPGRGNKEEMENKQRRQKNKSENGDLKILSAIKFKWIKHSSKCRLTIQEPTV